MAGKIEMMVGTEAENKQHQEIVRREVRELIKAGCPPNQISISGIQNPDLENWANKKGVVFEKTQEVDILSPEGFGDY